MRGCELRHVPELGHWEVVRDDSMRTTDQDVFAVGDGATIGGARYAVLEGAVAGFAAARDLGHVPQGDAAARERSVQRKLKRLLAVRVFLRQTFRLRSELIATLPRIRSSAAAKRCASALYVMQSATACARFMSCGSFCGSAWVLARVAIAQ